MFKLNCRFTTDKGTLNGGSVVDEKELKKHFSQSEIDGYIDDGLIMPLYVPESEKEDEPTLEVLLETAIDTLTVPRLKRVVKHYGLDASGNKDVLIERIQSFEALLAMELDELEEQDLKRVAVYFEVDTSLDVDAMISAIEEKSA